LEWSVGTFQGALAFKRGALAAEPQVGKLDDDQISVREEMGIWGIVPRPRLLLHRPARSRMASSLLASRSTKMMAERLLAPVRLLGPPITRLYIVVHTTLHSTAST
jgi:hypothetical protein